jgi:hypothetical protein
MHKLLEFERRNQPVAPRAVFAVRLARNFIAGGLLISASLCAGALGYHGFEHLPWIDAFLNAAMILGGMGPIALLVTNAGKLFATAYALYCGLVLIAAAGLVLAPVVHRLLHRFHMEK